MSSSSWAEEAAFTAALAALKAPSGSKIKRLAEMAVESSRHYKHVVYAVERAVRKSTLPSQVFAALYCIDAICRYSRANRQQGHKTKDGQDTYAARFSLHLVELLLDVMERCGREGREVVRKLCRTWKERAVFERAMIDKMLEELGPQDDDAADDEQQQHHSAATNSSRAATKRKSSNKDDTDSDAESGDGRKQQHHDRAAALAAAPALLSPPARPSYPPQAAAVATDPRMMDPRRPQPQQQQPPPQPAPQQQQRQPAASSAFPSFPPQPSHHSLQQQPLLQHLSHSQQPLPPPAAGYPTSAYPPYAAPLPPATAAAPYSWQQQQQPQQQQAQQQLQPQPLPLQQRSSALPYSAMPAAYAPATTAGSALAGAVPSLSGAALSSAFDAEDDDDEDDDARIERQKQRLEADKQRLANRDTAPPTARANSSGGQPAPPAASPSGSVTLPSSSAAAAPRRSRFSAPKSKEEVDATLAQDGHATGGGGFGSAGSALPPGAYGQQLQHPQDDWRDERRDDGYNRRDDRADGNLQPSVLTANFPSFRPARLSSADTAGIQLSADQSSCPTSLLRIISCILFVGHGKIGPDETGLWLSSLSALCAPFGPPSSITHVPSAGAHFVAFTGRDRAEAGFVSLHRLRVNNRELKVGWARGMQVERDGWDGDRGVGFVVDRVGGAATVWDGKVRSAPELVREAIELRAADDREAARGWGAAPASTVLPASTLPFSRPASGGGDIAPSRPQFHHPSRAPPVYTDTTATTAAVGASLSPHAVPAASASPEAAAFLASVMPPSSSPLSPAASSPNKPGLQLAYNGYAASPYVASAAANGNGWLGGAAGEQQPSKRPRWDDAPAHLQLPH